MIPSDRQFLHYQFKRIVPWCYCRGVAANDLPRVTGSSEQKSSTNFAPEAHMRIRFGKRQEAPIVLLEGRNCCLSIAVIAAPRIENSRCKFFAQRATGS